MQLKKILKFFLITIIITGLVRMAPLAYSQSATATATFDQSAYTPDASGNITTIVRVRATPQQFVRLYKIYVYFNTADLTVTNITYAPAIGVVSSTLGGDDGSNANLAVINGRSPGEIRLLGENQTSTGASLDAGQNIEFARVTFHVNNTNQINIYTGDTSTGNNSYLKVINQTNAQLESISIAKATAIVNSTTTTAPSCSNFSPQGLTAHPTLGPGGRTIYKTPSSNAFISLLSASRSPATSTIDEPVVSSPTSGAPNLTFDADSSGSGNWVVNTPANTTITTDYDYTVTATVRNGTQSAQCYTFILRVPKSSTDTTCPYENTQVKFRNANNIGSWTTTRTITADQSVRVGGFHNGSNTLATDITSISWIHATTGTTGNVDTNGGVFSPPSDLSPGTYTFTALTVGKTGANCTDAKPLTVNPTTAPVLFTKFFRIAESPTALSSAPWKPYTAHPMPYTHTLVSPLTNGETRVIHVQFKSSTEVVSQVFTKTVRFTPDPTITRLDCTHSPTGVGTNITIKGVNLGSQGDNGKVKVKGEEVDVTSWDETTGTISLTAPQRLEGRVAVAVTTNDNKTITKNCTINLTTIEFETTTQCKTPGQFSASNVDVKVFERQVAGLTSPEPIQRQKITIDASGKPQGFVPKFEKGKNYTLLIKVPGALAKKAEFKAEGGTTVLDPISFPVGDIAPASAPDGKINAFDKSELIRQWSLARDVSKTGDFNLDSRINSLDYSCMVKNFNASDETYSPLTVQTSPSPSATVSPSASLSPSPSPVQTRALPTQVCGGVNCQEQGDAACPIGHKCWFDGLGQGRCINPSGNDYIVGDGNVPYSCSTPLTGGQ